MNSVPKTFRVKSFGCQMNVYDGERMAELLGANGMTAAGEGEGADLVVLNTCHIREKAAEKAYSEVGRAARMVRSLWSRSPAASPRPREPRPSAGRR